MTQEVNYSDKDLIPILLDQKNTMKRLIEQGDKYDGIIETMQNAVDSPNDPYNDNNTIVIAFYPPFCEAATFKQILTIWDEGASLLKQYDNIHDFIHAKKSISKKGLDEIGMNGQGMVQMHKVSKVQRIVTMTGNDIDKDNIYLFYMLASPSNDESEISFTRPEVYSVTSNNMKKLGIFSRGTRIDFLEPYEDADPIDTRIAINKLRETFGWRMIQSPKLKILTYIIDKEKILQPPTYLKGKTAKDVDHLVTRVGTRTIRRDGVPKKVNPEAKGFLVKEQSGKGDIVIHVMGYRICTLPSGEQKKGTLYINCNELKYILNPTRKGFTDQETIEELINHCRPEFRSCEDIITDKFDQRKEKSILTRINKMMSPLMTKWLKEMRTRIGEGLIDGIPIKSLGNHDKRNSGTGGDVHKPVDKHPKLPPIGEKPEDPETPTQIVRESTTEENKNRGVFEHVEINNTSESDDLLSFDRTTNTLIIYSNNKAYDFCMNPSFQDDRCVPHFARMFLKLQNEDLSKEDYEKKLFNLQNQIAGGI